jgi:hypothetical protein
LRSSTARERVEAEVLEVRSRVDRVAPAVAEHAAAWPRTSSSTHRRRSPPGAPARRARAASRRRRARRGRARAREQRRQQPRLRLRAQRAVSSAHGDEQRLGRAARGVEQLQSLLVGQRATPWRACGRGRRRRARRSCRCSHAPHASDAPAGPRAARLGQRVEEGVRRGVVALPGLPSVAAADENRTNSTAPVAGQLVQVDRARRASGAARAQRSGVERADDAVVEHAGACTTRSSGMLSAREQRGELLAVGRVARGDLASHPLGERATSSSAPSAPRRGG